MKLNKTFVINFALIVFLILVIGFPAFPDYISHIHRICSASNWEYGVLANNHYTFLNDIAHVFGIQTICSIEEYYISNELITPLLQGFPAIKVSGVFFFDWARLLLSLTYYVLAYNYIKTIQFQPNNIGSLTPVSNLLISTFKTRTYRFSVRSFYLSASGMANKGVIGFNLPLSIKTV